ncbi:hypothetical protein SAY86_027721 [Trapa natans]|uniref:NAB domain-containing protein n=1 Tax=Trapa natans TaxID=22666 RepID=A0AAN7KLX8_TRANT|nr:hypothetical protein SAY86_027721 [Trapa natans]
MADMEEKVGSTLKLIHEDGDSFAKRAEMYYKKRPELISFVEETFRAYRALAERYDHMSTELQNANNTIASVFPGKVPFEMDEEDEDVHRGPSNAAKPNIPGVPKAPLKDLENMLFSGAKKLQSKKAGKPANAPAVSRSGLTKPEGLEKIDKLQKDILELQTVKEFVKSSYEGGLAKYWEIEKKINGMQEEVLMLQDEFGGGVVIEDEEARRLMAAAALKSCQESLADLREKRRSSAQEAKKEQARVKETWQKFGSLKKEIAPDLQSGENGRQRSGNDDLAFDESLNRKEGEELEEKIQEHFQGGMEAEALTVTGMAEKIDELVNKVIGLETAVSTQNALVERLRTETDYLQSQIQILEDEKVTRADGSKNMSSRMREMEEKLNDIRDLNASVRAEDVNLQTNLAEADCNLDHLSKKVHSVKTEDNEQEVTSLTKETEPLAERISEDSAAEEKGDLSDAGASESIADVEQAAHFEKINPPPSRRNDKANGSSENSIERPQLHREAEEPGQSQQTTSPDEPNREEMLLSEHTTTLGNYKEAKKKLVEVQKMNPEGGSDEMAVQMRELKGANALKDEEIRSLREKLSLLQTVVAGRTKDSKMETSEHIAPNGREMDIEALIVDHPQPISEMEEKLRMDIDQVLEENLDFWMRFSAALHQIQKNKTAVEDLKVELSKLDEKRKDEGSGYMAFSIKSDAKPVYKYLTEIQTELNIWMEKCVLLKDEQQKRLSSLCHIQDEITNALKTSAEDDDFRFTSHQAAKFQGEVLNMKQENSKVAQELQAGLDHIAVLQTEVKETLAKLNEEFGFAETNPQNSQQKQPGNQNRVPLRSFIFDSKLKKNKASIFTYMTPAMHRKYNGLKAAF